MSRRRETQRVRRRVGEGPAAGGRRGGGGSGAARGKEGRGSAWERRDGTPGRAPHGKGCTLEEQRLVAENDVEPGLGWLAAACGRRIWRWGGGPGAGRPRSDGSASVHYKNLGFV